MNTLVLIGLLLVAAGIVLLGLRVAGRVRRQFSAEPARPRTVADLVRIRQETAAAAGRPVQPAPTTEPAVAERVATEPAAPAPELPAQRVAAPETPPVPVPAQARPTSAFVAPSPRPTPVAGRVRRESPEPPSLPLGGDNSPWQRGARMAVGLGGGQPWREPPAPPTPLRIVPTAEPEAPVEAAEPEAPAEPAAPAASTEPAAPMRLVPRESAPEPEPAPAADGADAQTEQTAVRLESAGSAPPVDAADEAQTEQTPIRLVPAEAAEPARPAPVVNRDAVWIEPGAVAAAESAAQETDSPQPVGQPAVEPAVRGTVSPEPVGLPAAEPVVQETASPEAVGSPAVESALREAAPPEPVGSPPAESAAPEPEPAEPPAAGAGTVGLAAAALGGAALAAGAAGAAPAGARPAETPEEQNPVPDDRSDAAVPERRNRQTSDERAAEQAAADLALLRTFGFTDAGQRPDSAPVVAMEHADEPGVPVGAGAAQPVRYRVVRRDGSVVGGATVTLLDDRGGDVAAGAADDQGRGQVLAPAPGGYVLVSTAAGHQPGAVAISVADAATETDVLIARSASVSGNVRGEDGPIVGARVTLVQDGEAVDAVDTDADGAYRITDIGAGEYGLSVAAPGCEPSASLLEVAEEDDVRHDAELSPATPVAESGRADDAMSRLR